MLKVFERSPAIFVLPEECSEFTSTIAFSIVRSTIRRVRTETAAVLRILDEIRAGTLELVWSYVNESENLENPFLANMWAISKWKDMAGIEIAESPRLLGLAGRLTDIGIGAGDALHLASAVEASADFFLTTDDRILRKLTEFEGVIVFDPIRMVAKIDEHAN